MKNLHVTISGNVVEVDETTFGIATTAHKRNGGRKPKGARTTNESEDTQYRKQCRVAAKKLTRLIQCNFTESFTLMTLTFRRDVTFDTTDFDQCREQYTNFIKRLRANKHFQNSDLTYIAIPEFHQDNHIHFHVLCRLAVNDRDKIEAVWKNGHVDMRHVQNKAFDEIIIANYLKKDIFDLRLQGKKRYLPSQGLKKPLKLYFNDEESLHGILDAYEATHLNGYDLNDKPYGYLRHDEYYARIPEEVLRNAANNFLR